MFKFKTPTAEELQAIQNSFHSSVCPKIFYSLLSDSELDTLCLKIDTKGVLKEYSIYQDSRKRLFIKNKTREKTFFLNKEQGERLTKILNATKVELIFMLDEENPFLIEVLNIRLSEKS